MTLSSFPQPSDVHHLHSLPQGKSKRCAQRHAPQYFCQDYPVYCSGEYNVCTMNKLAWCTVGWFSLPLLKGRKKFSGVSDLFLVSLCHCWKKHTQVNPKCVVHTVAETSQKLRKVMKIQDYQECRPSDIFYISPESIIKIDYSSAVPVQIVPVSRNWLFGLR